MLRCIWHTLKNFVLRSQKLRNELKAFGVSVERLLNHKFKVTFERVHNAERVLQLFIHRLFILLWIKTSLLPFEIMAIFVSAFNNMKNAKNSHVERHISVVVWI